MARVPGQTYTLLRSMHIRLHPVFPKDGDDLQYSRNPMWPEWKHTQTSAVFRYSSCRNIPNFSENASLSHRRVIQRADMPRQDRIIIAVPSNRRFQLKIIEIFVSDSSHEIQTV